MYITKYKIMKYLFNAIIITSILSLFYSFNNILSVIGQVSFVLFLIIVFLSIFFNQKTCINQYLKYIFFAGLILLFVNMLLFLIDNSNIVSYLKASIQIVYILLIIFISYYFGKNNYLGSKKILYLVYSITIFLTIFIILTSNLKNSINTNNISISLMNLIFFLSILSTFYKYKWKIYFFIIILFLLLFITDSRSVIGGIIIGIFITKLYNRYSNSFVYFIIPILYFVGVYLILYVFIELSDLLTLYNGITQEYTHKNLKSGRNSVWPVVYELIIQKPIFGYGPGLSISNFTEFHKSAHNFYLQILFQGGIVYLISMVVFIISIYYALINNNKNLKYRSILIGYFFAILFVQIFEVTLTQNHFNLSLLFWIMVGYSIGHSQYLNINYQKGN